MQLFLLFFLALCATVWLSCLAWRVFGTGSPGKLRALGIATGLVIIALPDVVYFNPRYGGYLSYLIGDIMARSETGAIEGELGAVRSMLSIYYGDNDRRYPERLDELWKTGKYLTKPPRRAHVFALETPDRYLIVRPHWYKDADQVKNFSSPHDSDDTGGWGYVNDPKSPDYGHFFVNCTHQNFRRRQPWNLLGSQPETTPAPTPSTTAPPPTPLVPPRTSAPAPTASVLEGFVGRVFSGRQKPLGDAQVVFIDAGNGTEHRTASDQLGRYGLSLPPGRYRVSATHDAHKPYSSERGLFIVQPGRRGVGNIFMDPL
jgi:hypothetical protein